jgi:hypothetical protein
MSTYPTQARTAQAEPPAAEERIAPPSQPVGASRLTTETKASFKTTEFFAYLAVLLGILISAAVITGGGDHVDIFTANKAWLYVTILTVGYMISRGLAKAGSRDPYWDQPNTGNGNAPLTERIKTAAQVLTDGDGQTTGTDRR